MIELKWNKKQKRLWDKLDRICLFACHYGFDESDTIAVCNEKEKKVIVKFTDELLPERYKKIYGISECDEDDEFSVNKGIHIAKISFLKKVLDQAKSDFIQAIYKWHSEAEKLVDELCFEQDELKKMLNDF